MPHRDPEATEIRVPMAIRGEVTWPLGFLQLNGRAIVLLFAMAPLAGACLYLPFGPPYRLGACVFVLGSAYILSTPRREGVWVATFALHRLLEPLFPRVVHQGQPRAARIKRLGDHLNVVSTRRPLLLPWISRLLRLQRAGGAAEGLFERAPGGWCAIFALDGPIVPPQSDDHLAWCSRLLQWMGQIKVPAQIYVEVTSWDRHHAEVAFERSLRRELTRLVDFERRFAGAQAEHSIVMRAYVVFTPGLAGLDGVPRNTQPHRLHEWSDCSRADAEHVRQFAAQRARDAMLSARPLAQSEIGDLLARTVVGAGDAVIVDGETVIQGSHRHHLAITGLPRAVGPGVLVRALTEARVRGSVSFYLAPVDTAIARRQLKSQLALYEHAFRHSRSSDAEALYQDGKALDQDLLHKRTRPLRVGVVASVMGDSAEQSAEALERLQGRLQSMEFETTQVTAPGFSVAGAAAPGGLPLPRTLLLTTAEVAAALLPVQGTPFGRPEDPYLGIDMSTGASVYYNSFRNKNYSLLIVGSSGAGKSVADKALLVRHVNQGAMGIVVDPDSEFQPVIAALGGTYIELGRDTLNAFAVDPSISPDDAAQSVMPVLSIMGGVEQGYSSGKPIRGLSGQDKAWLHNEVLSFFTDWREQELGREPILGDFCGYLEQVSIERARRAEQRGATGRTKRCLDIAERLTEYTVGRKGQIFNRPSTVVLRGRALGIGLYHLANQYRADLTPALAFLLNAILFDVERSPGRRIILLEEAHHVLSDPDAGEVLKNLARTLRKRGGGLWASSQSVGDFVSGTRPGGDPSAGEILATVASSKLIMGVEDAVAEGVQRTFKLNSRELAAITTQQEVGKGVLIADGQRAIVRVQPGPHLMPLVNTSNTDLVADL